MFIRFAGRQRRANRLYSMPFTLGAIARLKGALLLAHQNRVIASSFIFVLLVSIGTNSVADSAVAPYALDWVRQLGTDAQDLSYSITPDNMGNIYISGSTTGSLQDGTAPASRDAFVAKYDITGNHIWSRQLNTLFDDQSLSVATDEQGNVYMGGWTDGSLDGINAGKMDAFFSKYNAHGTLLWSRQLGTPGSSNAGIEGDDKVESIAVDSKGNIFLAGQTGGTLGSPYRGDGDAFLSKYDSSGNLLWIQQSGTSRGDSYNAVALDGKGNVYTTGVIRSQTPLLTKYDSNGNQIWSKELTGSQTAASYSVATDSGGYAYITGLTNENLADGTDPGRDAFLAKYNPMGDLVWREQLGTIPTEDISFSVSVDGADNLLIAGWTRGSLGGDNAGDIDTFFAKYTPSGDLLWTRQIGTDKEDRGYSIGIDELGNAYITGWTYGSLGGENAGNADVFLAKYTIPEPTSLALFGLGGLLLNRRRR